MDFVVARHREDIGWTSDLPPGRVWVYTKGGEPGPLNDAVVVESLPNVGREAHTYLHHIVARYDALAPVTVFLQGHPFDHSPNLLRDLGRLGQETGYVHLCDYILDWESTCQRSLPQDWVPMAATYEHLFGPPAPDRFLEFGAGAQFAVSAEAIRSRPREFYERALRYSEQGDDTVAHAFERLWMYIFTGKMVT